MKKAIVIATGEIVEVEKTILRGVECYIQTTGEKIGSIYMEYDLDFGFDCDYTPDYWTRLEHQYAGMAMQGLMSYVEQITPKVGRSFCDEIVDISLNVAHTLVEKYKEKEKK